MIEPTSKGVAGQSLPTEPWLVALNQRGFPDFKPLKNIQVAAYQDPACTIPAAGTLTVKDFGLLTYVGIAIYTKFTNTAAGKSYFQFKADGVRPICSKLVAIAAGPAHHLALIGGSNQTGVLGATLPEAARILVLDRYENVVKGTRIAFGVASGGGSVDPAQASSGEDGIATTTLKLGPTVGLQSFSARLPSGSLSGFSASLLLSATAQGPTAPPPTIASQLALSGPVSRLAGDCAAFSVRALASDGQVAKVSSDVAVSLSGLGSSALFADSTCAQSVASVVLAANSSQQSFFVKGTHSESLLIQVLAAGLQASPVYPYTIRAAAPASLHFLTQPSAAGVAGAPLAVQPVVIVRDAFGNTVSDAGLPVSLAKYSDQFCASPDLNGESNGPSGGLTFTRVGTYYLAASAAGVSSACSSAIQVLAGPAASIVIVEGDAQSATVGSTLPAQLKVRVSDAFGNVVFGAQVNFAAGLGGGTATPAAATTDGAGEAVTTYTLGAASGQQTLVASIASGASATLSATATHKLPVHLALTGAPNATAGACSSAFTIQLQDGDHSPTIAQVSTEIVLSGAEHGSFYSDSACANAIESLTVPAAASLGEFYFRDTRAESATLVAQSNGLGSASARVSVDAASAAQLVFSTQPSASAIAGTVLGAQPAVSAQDAFGNPTSSFAGDVSLSAFSDDTCETLASGSLSAAANPTATDQGYATFAGVSYSNLGLIYLKASTTGLASACSEAVALSAAMTLVAGTAHTCLLNEGGVKCWGFNTSGSLGNGTNVNASTPQQVTAMSEGVITLGAGGQHSCASKADGLYCWGLNVAGQLGDGSLANRNTPVAVTGVAGGVSQIAAGDSHTCALLNGSVLCWGSNTFGQLGSGNKTSSALPLEVQGLPETVTSIAAASNSSCAVTSEGSAYCWGFNDYGQLGNGEMQDSAVPVQVQGLGAITTIAPGFENTCALVSGEVHCWGRNDFGQLGNGTFTSTVLPQKVQGFGSRVTTLLSGGQNFSCVILDNGAVQCWGQNTRGQLGDNRVSGTQSALPVQVVGLTSGYQALRAGYIHACASDGTQIKCWGWGSSGQLGNGELLQSAVPVSVAGY